MARFIGEVRGNRGAITRLGSKSSGMNTECNGWNSGVKVTAIYNAEFDIDEFLIYATNGSGHGNGDSDGFIGRVIDGKFTPKGDKK